MTETRGSVLHFCIAFALRGVRLHVGRRFLKLELTEEQRYEVVDRVIAELRKRHGYADWLDEAQPEKSNGPHWDYCGRDEKG